MRKIEDSELTPWFDESVKPVRPGVYERQLISGCPWFAKFDKHWKMGCGTPKNAADVKARSRCQNLPWRGLKKEN